MLTLKLKFDSTLPDADERSKASVRKLANALMAKAQASPEGLQTLSRKYCCLEESQWSAGQGPPGISQALDVLKFGQVASAPVESDWFFVIPKRLNPADVRPESPQQYSLPSPNKPDFEHLIPFNNGRNIAMMTRGLSQHIRGALRWDPERYAALASVLEQLALTLEREEPDEPPERSARIHRGIATLREHLSASEFAEFTGAAEAWATSQMLR